jgi:hypothetical protein
LSYDITKYKNQFVLHPTDWKQANSEKVNEGLLHILKYDIGYKPIKQKFHLGFSSPTQLTKRIKQYDLSNNNNNNNNYYNNNNNKKKKKKKNKKKKKKKKKKKT